MDSLGTIRVTRDADRLPVGFVFTAAPTDLIICLSIPYYTCIVGWDKCEGGGYKPIFKRAVREIDVSRINDILLYAVTLKAERKVKRKKA